MTFESFWFIAKWFLYTGQPLYSTQKSRSNANINVSEIFLAWIVYKQDGYILVVSLIFLLINI